MTQEIERESWKGLSLRETLTKVDKAEREVAMREARKELIELIPGLKLRELEDDHGTDSEL